VQRHTFKSELTLRRDPRITPIGRFLRATKLDELPQLVNVLRGEMSVVGPRPESPRFVAHYTPEMLAALNLRPGLTGPASVLFRSQEQLLDGMDFEQYYVAVLMPVKMGINLEYVAHHSLWVDLTIIARTVIALFRPSPPPPLVSPAEAVRAALPVLDEQGEAVAITVAVPTVPVRTPAEPVTVSSASPQAPSGSQASQQASQQALQQASQQASQETPHYIPLPTPAPISVIS